MTTLTIDLPPDLYDRLRAEAQRQGKAEQDVAQALLAEHLTTPPADVPLYLALAPNVQALLATMTEADMLVPPQGTPDASRLFQSWNAEDAASAIDEDEGEGTWDDVLRTIDAHRTSARKLFPELDTQP